jgi:hypothetical protein
MPPSSARSWRCCAASSGAPGTDSTKVTRRRTNGSGLAAAWRPGDAVGQVGVPPVGTTLAASPQPPGGAAPDHLSIPRVGLGSGEPGAIQLTDTVNPLGQPALAGLQRGAVVVMSFLLVVTMAAAVAVAVAVAVASLVQRYRMGGRRSSRPGEVAGRCMGTKRQDRPAQEEPEKTWLPVLTEHDRAAASATGTTFRTPPQRSCGLPNDRTVWPGIHTVALQPPQVGPGAGRSCDLVHTLCTDPAYAR